MGNRKKDIYQRLMDAFEDESFQKKINGYRYDIELELGKYMEWLAKVLDPSQKIYRSPESRIKSRASFQEKIRRKDYIHKWTVSENQHDIQNEILTKLPDLIGFRITCFFIDDEKVIYDRLKEYDQAGRFQQVVLDFSEKTRQKNGHEIYKVSGKYAGKVRFELQIKSAVHNIWGEVEHKTIYKGSQYAIDLKQRQSVTEEVFNVLKASDHQLLTLFTNQYTERDLVCGLFAEQTKNAVAEFAGTNYLAGHYRSFFEIFLQTGRDDIWCYVSNSLSKPKGTYRKRRVSLEHITPKIIQLAESIKAVFLEYYLQMQYRIAQELYIFENYDEFILYLAAIVISYASLDEEPDQIEGDAFSDDEETGESDAGGQKVLLDLLKDWMPDAAKEGK